MFWFTLEYYAWLQPWNTKVLSKCFCIHGKRRTKTVKQSAEVWLPQYRLTVQIQNEQNTHAKRQKGKNEASMKKL